MFAALRSIYVAEGPNMTLGSIARKLNVANSTLNSRYGSLTRMALAAGVSWPHPAARGYAKAAKAAPAPPAPIVHEAPPLKPSGPVVTPYGPTQQLQPQDVDGLNYPENLSHRRPELDRRKSVHSVKPPKDIEKAPKIDLEVELLPRRATLTEIAEWYASEGLRKAARDYADNVPNAASSAKQIADVVKTLRSTLGIDAEQPSAKPTAETVIVRTILPDNGRGRSVQDPDNVLKLVEK